MQNKANFPDTQMHLSYVYTINYEQKTMNNDNENKPNSKPIKPNSNPIQTQFQSQRLDDKVMNCLTTIADFLWVKAYCIDLFECDNVEVKTLANKLLIIQLKQHTILATNF